MGRRDPDPRPAVELWGAEARAAELPTVIQVGGRRSRRAPLLAIAAIVAVLAGGLALGGYDGEGSGLPREERDNRLRDDLQPPALGATTTKPRSTSTSTSTTTVLTGPVLPEPTGAALLLSNTNTRWTWLELDTGLRREVRMTVSDPYALVPVAGGVVYMAGSTAEYLRLPEGVPVSLGRADQILSSGVPDAVWLIHTSFDGPSMEGSEAVLVDLAGMERSGVVRLPAAYPIGGTDHGIVFSRGGRTYLAEESGIRPLALGDALRTNRSSVVVLACNDQAVCAPEIVDVATGRSRRLAPVANPDEMGISVLLSDAGDHLAIASYFGSGLRLQLYEVDGTSLGTTDLFFQSEPRWLPNDLGLVATGSDGSGVVRISVADDGLLVEPIGALDGMHGDFVYVIPR